MTENEYYLWVGVLRQQTVLSPLFSIPAQNCQATKVFYGVCKVIKVHPTLGWGVFSDRVSSCCSGWPKMHGFK